MPRNSSNNRSSASSSNDSSRRNSGESKNNNSGGRNQSSGGFTGMAKDRPVAAAAAAAAAVGAGVFLWSRRNQISSQLTNLSDQLQDWNENRTRDTSEYSGGEGAGFMAQQSSSGKSQSEIAQEAMALKEGGKSTTRPSDPMMDEQTKVGAVAY